MKAILGLTVLGLALVGCSTQQDVGDANKPAPKGITAPGAPAGGQGTAPSATPNPGAMETPK